MPDMIRYYLAQEPILDNVPTHLGSREDDLKYMLDHLPELVVKATNESGGYGMLMGPTATTGEIAKFREQIIANPSNYIGQPVVSLSQCPTWCDGAMAGRHVDFRPYIIYGESPKIVPSGLTRVALMEEALVVNSSQGGGSKDTWVLRD